MIKSRFVTAFAASLAFATLGLTGCNNLQTSACEVQNIEYGSLTIGDDTLRALDVSTLTKATVTVYGSGMSSVYKSDVVISGGCGSATIDKIPVGNNRVVEVKSNIDGAVMYAVVDIKSGSNTCNVTWETSKLGKVFFELIENKVDVSQIDDNGKANILKALPDVHATLINAEKAAKDYPNLSGDYTSEYGTVSISTSGLSGYTVQVTDISSEKVKVSSNSQSATLKAYPGSWKLKVLDSDGKVVETKDVVVGEDATTKATLSYSAAGPDISDKLIIFTKSADKVWAWENNGAALSELTGLTWSTQTSAIAATEDEMSNPSGWYKTDLTTVKSKMKGTGSIKFILNQGSEVDSGKKDSFWYDGTNFYDSDPTAGEGLKVTVENPQVPVKSDITITPSDGDLSLKGTISIAFTDGNSTISSAKAKINGKEYDMGTKATTFTKKVEDLGITEAGKTITVEVTVENKKGVSTKTASYTTVDVIIPPVSKNTFTWDNVNCYFVLTDRFYNGDTKNDHSYYRKNSGIPEVATFHGGDIKGLTDKLDYLNDLGVNAIWISAPYEQMHGWCTGGGAFPHYAFHGYYTQDWTYMDQNMGTIEEFRTFVNEAHKRGIRIIMDVVMNHTGYNTIEDMITYGFGKTSVTQHGWVDGGSAWNNNHSVTDYTSNDWSNWWSGWVRGFDGKFGFAAAGSGDLTSSLSGLPDVVTESEDKMNIPTFLQNKWNNEKDGTTVPSESGNTCGKTYGDYKLPSIANVDWDGRSGDWRTSNKGAPADYIVTWLSGWVREFGVDGFRCDTAKHVDKYRWGQLKVACEAALKAWRQDSSRSDGDTGAKEWTDNFWMTGEDWGHGNGTSDEYFSTGKFDSMINFSFQGSNKTFASTSCGTVPSTSTWSDYAGIGSSTSDTDGNGNCNSTLSYISSHDTGLLRHDDPKKVGTMFLLLPAGVQIYYGDESSRPYTYKDCGDSDMMTRGDMNWGSNTDTVKHWGRVGTFRKFNPAVGAGSQSQSGSTFVRKYTKGKVDANSIAISLSSTTLSGLPYADGTTVYNWYDGTSSTVSGGSATFSSSKASETAPVLCSDRNPSDYGVSF